jgi:hypothetical protein
MESSQALAGDTHAYNNDKQGSLFLYDALGESRLIHSDSKFGFFSLLTKKDGIYKTSNHKLIDMPKVLPLVPLDGETYISQAEFAQPNRRAVNLLRIWLVFVDLDCYKLSPAKALSTLFWICDENKIPYPSIVIFSGRGLQAKWLLEKPITRQLLPWWNGVQAALSKIFCNLGADGQARDVSRVFRLVGTTNLKSKERVIVMHVTHDEGQEPKRYCFEFLTEVFMPNSTEFMAHNDHPYTLEEQNAIVMRREAREARALGKPSLTLIQGKNINGLRKFSGSRLAWDRLEDIRKLIAIRGGVRPGQSMSTLFWTLNFLLLSGATHSSNMYYEAIALAKEFGFKDENRKSELSTLYAKAKDFNAGKKIKFDGKEYPALYTPRNSTLINIFNITDDEQRQLKTIISKDLAKERHRERELVRRRTGGSISREEYLSSYDEKRLKTLEMSKEGQSNRSIAKELGIDKRTVGRWLNKGVVQVRA